MSGDLRAELKRVIQTEGLFAAGDSVLIALSGGPDSVALLFLLLELAEDLEIKLAAAHYNHALRGRESDQDEAFVRELCSGLRIPLAVGRGSRAPSASGNVEKWARDRRYEFLLQEAARTMAVVATGHTLSDQTETFLLKLFRGAGPTGLSGIFPIRRQRLTDGTEVTVVRPLLTITHPRLIEYLQTRGAAFRQDSTNDDCAFDRNWVRHKLLPFVQERHRRDFDRIIGRTARLFREVDDFLEKEASAFLSRFGEREKGPAYVVRIKELQKLHPAVRKQVVRRLIGRVKGDLDSVTLGHIEDVLTLAENQSGRQIDLPGAVVVAREFESLSFYRAEAGPGKVEARLPVPGQVEVPELNKKIILRKVSDHAKTCRGILIKTGSDELVVRNRRAGDRYQLPESAKETALKKLFIEERVPLRSRDRLLILAKDDRILWVEGFAASIPEAPSADEETFEVIIETFHAEGESK